MHIDLIVTHACNKNCPLCDQRIATSPFKHMTWEEYGLLLEAMKGLRVRQVRLTGGEPLVHPKMSELIQRLRNDFPQAELLMATNGALLHRLTSAERDRFARITISYYGSYNHDVVQKVLRSRKEYRNIYFVDSRKMVDPDVDHALDEVVARRCFRMCAQRRPRVVGDKVYGCCLSEGIERNYRLESVHCELRPGWQREYRKLPTYKACRYCVTAHQNARNWMAACKSYALSLVVLNAVGNVARRLKRAVMRRRLLALSS